MNIDPILTIVRADMEGAYCIYPDSLVFTALSTLRPLGDP